VLLRST